MEPPGEHPRIQLLTEERELFGGDVCESNTPGTFFTPHTGFEDQGHHQGPSASIGELSRPLGSVSNRQRNRMRADAADERSLMLHSRAFHEERRLSATGPRVRQNRGLLGEPHDTRQRIAVNAARPPRSTTKETSIRD
jgi:hypothetical protein